MEPEQISALADGSLPDEDCVHLTPEDMMLLDTYQMIGDLIRTSEPVRSVRPDFADRLAKRLAEESPHVPSRTEME